MKVCIAFLAIALVAAQASVVPLVWPSGVVALPGHAVSLAHHVAVVPHVVVAAPIQTGYVAATRGSLHIAPLPGNSPAASHHLNLQPAPGTE